MRQYTPIVCGVIGLAVLLAGCGPSKVPKDERDASLSALLHRTDAAQRSELLSLMNRIEASGSVEQIRGLIAEADAIIDAAGVGPCRDECKQTRDRCVDRCDDAGCIKRCWGHYIICLEDCA